MLIYKGWKVFYLPSGSMHWKAERFGVSIRANSLDALKQMIDARPKN